MVTTLIEYLIYAVIGMAGGLLAGLLGIGGGIVTVPFLLLTFHWLGFQDTYAMQIALGTSLGAMTFTSASSAWAHHLQKGVRWDLVRSLSPGILFGSILGAVIADYLPGKELQSIFGFFMCFIGISFILPVKIETAQHFRVFPASILITFMIGTLISVISSLLGIGGGIITVPILTAYGIPLRKAISTSAVAGFVIALIGAISYLYLGQHHDTFKGSIGFLYLPAFIMIALASSIAAPYGARMAYILPTITLRCIFGVVLIFIGVWMLNR